jgi:hypothetical protein
LAEKGNAFRTNATTLGRKWQPVFEETGVFDFTKLNLPGSAENAEAYLSFWIYSPRALEDLLLEPNLPQVNFEVTQNDTVQVWLNKELIIAKRYSASSAHGATVVEGLKLRAGWNHFLVELAHASGRWEFSGRFTSSQPGFLAQLDSSLEKP